VTETRKIVLAIPQDEGLVTSFEKLVGSEILVGAQITLLSYFYVHVVPGSLDAYNYAFEEQKADIEKSGVQFLNNVKKKLFPNFSHVKTEFYFSANPKQDMCGYLKKTGAHLVVVVTHKKNGLKGLFMSSFTDYLIHFSPCDVLVLRS